MLQTTGRKTEEESNCRPRVPATVANRGRNATTAPPHPFLQTAPYSIIPPALVTHATRLLRTALPALTTPLPAPARVVRTSPTFVPVATVISRTLILALSQAMAVPVVLLTIPIWAAVSTPLAARPATAPIPRVTHPTTVRLLTAAPVIFATILPAAWVVG